MQRNIQLFERLKHVEKRKITVLIRLLENVIEVANGLMIVQRKAKIDRLIHCDFDREKVCGKQACGTVSRT